MTIYRQPFSCGTPAQFNEGVQYFRAFTTNAFVVNEPDELAKIIRSDENFKLVVVRVEKKARG